jgi:hypothetical protein
MMNMRKAIYWIALMAFPVMAMGQGIPVVGGPPPDTQALIAQFEQTKSQMDQIRNAKNPGGAMPVIDANQLTQLVEINYTLGQVRQRLAQGDANTALLAEILNTQVKTLEALKAIEMNTKQPVTHNQGAHHGH